MIRSNNEQFHPPTCKQASARYVPGLTQHVPVIDVQRNVDALLAGDFVEVARVEFGLDKPLNVDELVHSRAIPNAPGIGLA
eukprot:7200539-Prymnesium_polylepis.1